MPLRLDHFGRLVAVEIDRARVLHQAMVSVHEGYAVILEEVRELEHEVFRRDSERDDLEVLKELVQVAAMCQRMAEDLHFVVGPGERYYDSMGRTAR